jgi:hypothetical protein
VNAGEEEPEWESETRERERREAEWGAGERRVSASAKRRRRIRDGRRHGMAHVASARRDLGRRRCKRGGSGDGGGTRIGDGRGLCGGLPRSHMWPAARWSGREVGGRAAEEGKAA